MQAGSSMHQLGASVAAANLRLACVQALGTEHIRHPHCRCILPWAEQVTIVPHCRVKVLPLRLSLCIEADIMC